MEYDLITTSHLIGVFVHICHFLEPSSGYITYISVLL